VFSRIFKTLLFAVVCVVGGGIWVWRLQPSPPVRNPPAPEIATPQPSPPTLRVVAPSISTETGTHPVQTVLEAQIALVRQGISPGSIDGVAGAQTRSALMVFQRKKGLAPSGALDEETKAALLITPPAMTNYTVTAEDLARLMPVPKTWLEKSEQPRLDFETIGELLGEKSFSNPKLIRALNPNVNWANLPAGTVVTLPDVQYPSPPGRAVLVRISLEDRVLEAFDDGSNLLVHFPCSIGRLAEKRPEGELRVTVIVIDPNYTMDPAVFPESPEAQEIGRKLIIPAGPNNPVGVAWIGLDRPGYGIHGTPAPEQVGRTESHGCFRLANWNADYLAHMVWVGMPVQID
jgi:lipoprotein-anchoring transpeptidase ErfK/SrfK